MRVVCNVAMSVDGKIGPPDRSHVSFGSSEDHRRMSLLRRQADAIITGGNTFRVWPQPMIENPRSLLDPPQRTRPPYNVVITRTGNVPVGAPAFSDGRVQPIVITTTEAKLPDGMPARVDVVRLPNVDATAVLTTLEQRGVSTALLESGGDLSSMFFRAGVVDELYLTLVPVLLGGRGAPSPVDGAPWPVKDAPRLKLLECTLHGGELFLHYTLR